MNANDNRTLAAIKQSVYYRNYRRARDRALVRLSQAYPEDYRILFEEEKARDAAEGKAWSNRGTSIVPPDDDRARTRLDSAYRFKQANADEQNEGNVGGEG